MDCSIAAKLVEMLRVSKCFGECVCDCDLHDVTTPKLLGKWFLVYISKSRLHVYTALCIHIIVTYVHFPILRAANMFTRLFVYILL